MKKFVVFTMAAMIMFGTSVFGAEKGDFDDFDKDTRSIGVGIVGIQGDTSVSGSLVVPVEEGKLVGWVGGHAQRTEVDNSLVESYHARTEIGYILLEDVFPFSVNVFVDWIRDSQRGIEGQRAVGGFIAADLYEQGTFKLNGGVGNFVENSEVRTDLELEQDDPTVVRALAYLKGTWHGYSVRVQFDPTLDFDSVRGTLEPAASYMLTDNFSVVAKAKLGFDSAAVLESAKSFSTYSVQGTLNF